MDERRCEQRYEIERNASLMLNETSMVIPCKVHDVSLGGIKISFSKDIFPELLSKADIILSDSLSLREPIESVAWNTTDSQGNNFYGLRFIDISDSEKTKIAQYINHNFLQEKTANWWVDLA